MYIIMVPSHQKVCDFREQQNFDGENNYLPPAFKLEIEFILRIVTFISVTEKQKGIEDFIEILFTFN